MAADAAPHTGPMTPRRADLTWSLLDAGAIDTSSLYDVLALRSAVFVVEQQCAYLDLDGLDLLEGTVHVTGRMHEGPGGIAAYARVLPPDERFPAPRIGRVIVSGEMRGQQLGRELVRRSLDCCEGGWPGLPVELGAQAHLAGFYASLGFVEVSAPYDEDGIEHVWMRRSQ